MYFEIIEFRPEVPEYFQKELFPVIYFIQLFSFEFYAY